MKKVIGLFVTVLSLFLITGCYMEGKTIRFGAKPGSYHSKEEIIDYVDNFSKCGEQYYGKENCNLKGNYTIINESIDDSREYESRVITFKLNDYDIEFTGESSCYCETSYCLGCSYGFQTNYLEASSEFLIKKFIEENNIPDNLLKYQYYNIGVTMYISSMDDISKVANYCNKYYNYIKNIENNSNVKFSFPFFVTIKFNPTNKDKYHESCLGEGISMDELANETYYLYKNNIYNEKVEYNDIEQFLNAYVEYHKFEF